MRRTGCWLPSRSLTDKLQRLHGGKVVFHSPDGDACWYKARELNLDPVAVRFLGEYPDPFLFNLWVDGLTIVEEIEMDQTLTMEEIKARYAPD